MTVPFTAAEKLDVFVGTEDGCNHKKLVFTFERGAERTSSRLTGRPLISARHSTMLIHCAGSGATLAQDLDRAEMSMQLQQSGTCLYQLALSCVNKRYL